MLVCHGNPSGKMLQDYLKTIEDKHGSKINAFTFRDKSIGWGKKGSVVNNVKKRKIWESIFYKIVKRITQLRTPSIRGKRDEIKNLYSLRGWKELNIQFKKWFNDTQELDDITHSVT